MTRARLVVLGLAWALAAGCSPAKGTDSGGPAGDGGSAGDGGAAGDGGSAGDGGGDTGGGDTGSDTLPPDPTPFTLTITGAADLTLTFDESTCTQPMGSANFSQFWRNAEGEHVFVLTLQLLGTFDGARTYTSADDGARVKLQEEAGGELRYFYNDTDRGDSVEATIEHIDEEQAWGEFSFAGLHDSGGGAIDVSPQPIPIWCPTVD